jgi:WD40-like Beta Propeller Repeat
VTTPWPRWAVAVAILGGLMATAAPAVARTAPSSATEIVFGCNLSDEPGYTHATCAVDGDGTDTRILFLWNSLSIQAQVSQAVSPNGERVAYPVYADAEDDEFTNDGVWVAGASGADPHAVWTGPTCHTSCDEYHGYLPGLPSWNPAGTELAISEPSTPEGKDGAGCRLWVVGAGGENPHLLTNGSRQPLTCGSSAAPVWSADGTKLAYRGPAGVTVVAAGGGHPTVLASAATPETWSSDGKALVAVTNSGAIETIPVVGGKPQVLLSPPARMTYVAAAYSPDGSQLAIERKSRTAGCQIDTLATGGNRRLTVVAPADCEFPLTGWVRLPSRPGAPDQPLTTSPPATTPAPLPSDPQPTPQAAAEDLMQDWEQGNRSAGTTVATPSAVASLFATPFTGTAPDLEDCGSTVLPAFCLFTPLGPQSSETYSLQLLPEGSDWYVEAVSVEDRA